MKVLAISDKIDPLIYSPRIRSLVGPVELVLGCGDLAPYYLDYVISMLDVPCFWVYGNHASGAEFRQEGMHEGYRRHPMDIHGRVVVEQGLVIAGLEGSIRYNSNPRFQYTQTEMRLNTWKLIPAMLWQRARLGRHLDILVAHSPPAGIHDGSDRAHQGFESFLWLMRTFRPRYLLHGHKHVYRSDEVTETRYHDTTVINVYPWKVLDL
ncbi:MAG: metallophosphoesterase [Chloroflexota bacterium]|nr:metallophosphoesterase [Chloroflexota bacterium]